MKLSAMLTSLPLPVEAAARQAAALGFTHVDPVAMVDRPPAHRDTLAETGLFVACAAVGRDLPADHTLDAAAVDNRRAALEAMKRQVADAAQLGATHCYVIPGRDATSEGLARFAESCSLLADFAAQRMVRLCVEHIPGRALPTVAGTLAWLRQVDHANLVLLLDIGHCLISGEEPARAVEQAGSLLGHVHLDDNDGVGDLHWPLLTGRLTRDTLERFLHTLVQTRYAGRLTFELNPANPDPVAALREGKALVEELQGAS